jgi:capsular polysaccharide export protein
MIRFCSNVFGKNPALPPLEMPLGHLVVGRSILRQRQLCRILAHAGWSPVHGHRKAAACAGWGRKQSGLKAASQARQRGVPSVALEDGFLRSLSLGQLAEPPLSIIIDDVGIYYDATRPSRLENLLNDPALESRVDPERARRCMALMRREKLSKYNHADDHTLDHLADDFVLVIDQTANDPSIHYGRASEVTFSEMLQAARDENPGKQIVVKTHPGVVAGVNQGHFDRSDQSVEYIVEQINPWSLLERASSVYTVTSGMGMEALIAGKKVRCFGMPYYAGWGLTTDQLSCERRERSLSLEALFTAAYLEYPVYYDPFFDRLTNFERVAAILSFWKSENSLHRKPTFCVGMSKWKQPSVRAFVRSTHQEPRFIKSADRAIAEARKVRGRIVVWASKARPELEEKCQRAGVELLRMEDGFLRSKGLGSDLVPPLSLVLDRQGIYYDPTRRSDLEALIASGAFDEMQLDNARQMRQQIVNAGLTKYNVGKIRQIPVDAQGRRIILVPGQVADDASIRLGTSDSGVSDNLGLLKATRADNPTAFIIYKPHPDVVAGNRYGRIADPLVLRYADYIASDISSDSILAQCDEVWTMTSLIGFEALLRNKAVTCFGLPFYAGWGLTTDRVPAARRGRQATVDEILAAAYLQYASYIFPGQEGFLRVPTTLAPALIMPQKAEGLTQRSI